MKSLNLKDNKISNIGNLVSIPNLKFLDLSGNQLTTVEEGQISDTLRVLILARNNLSFIDNSFKNF